MLYEVITVEMHMIGGKRANFLAGIAVRRVLRIGLGTPLSPWASSRDRTAEAATLCALASGTAHRISKEIYNLAKTEVREKVLAMKAIWSMDEPEFHGEHVNFDRNNFV